jgi:hypothetical protein
MNTRIFAIGLLSASAAYPQAFEVAHARHLLGLTEMKRDVDGTLAFSEKSLEFRSGKSDIRIEYSQMQDFAVEQDTSPLAHGVTGQIVQFGPFGCGQAISMVRKGVDVLTIEYTDASEATHGAILILPKGWGEKVSAKLEGSVARREGEPVNTRPASPVTVDLTTLAAVLIKTPTRGDASVPLQYRMAVYENLIADLEKCKDHGAVWRQGDRNAPSELDLTTLETRIESFERGSERKRALVPMWGATVLRAEVRVINPVKDTTVAHEIKGAVRIHGEGLQAAGLLAKNIVRSAAPDLVGRP